MSEEFIPRGTLKYIVRGVATDRGGQHDLQAELYDNLPNAHSIVVLPVVEGFSVEIEMSDLRPFSEESFEPYVAEHVLLEAAQLRCTVTGSVQLKLLKAHFS